MKIDKYNIAENITRFGFDYFCGNMSAKIQREVFGAYLFGKKYILIDMKDCGRVSGTFKTAFGQDWNSFDFSFDQIAEAVNSGRKLSF